MKLSNRWAVLSAGLAISVVSYLIDCLVAIYVTSSHAELSWYKRGLYTGPLVFSTLAWTVAVVVYPVCLRTKFSIRRAHRRGPRSENGTIVEHAAKQKRREVGN